MQAPRRPTEAELDAFEATCARLSGFDPGLSFEWVDGWLTALALLPEAAAPADWLALLTGDAFERAFGDPEDQAAHRQVLENRLAILRDQLGAERLDESPDQLWLNPLLAEWTDEGRAEILAAGEVPAEEVARLQNGALWAEALIVALETLQQHWQGPRPAADDEARDQAQELLRHVSVLTLGHSEPGWAEHLVQFYEGRDPPARDELVDNACFALQDLRLWFVDHAPRTEPRRVDKAPGRNDPCHCGSGLKYKKCHGALA